MFAKIWHFFGFSQSEASLNLAQKHGQSPDVPEPFGTPGAGTPAAYWLEMRKAAGWQPLQKPSSRRQM